MTIKKRIFYANTMMVFVSLIILLGVGGGLITLFKGEFLDWYGGISRLSEHTYEVQDLLQNADEYPADWDAFADALAEYDFRLNISTESDEKYYENLKFNEWEAVEAVLAADKKAGRIDSYLIEGVTILVTRCQADGVIYDIYAASCPEDISFWGMDRGMFETFLIVFLVIGLLAIAVILLCSQFFTRYLIQKISEPMEELSIAAKRVSDGDLSVPIDYQQEDEFKSVCDSFDLMQKNLKEGMERNAAYERARTEMVSGISHDLRTPLTSVKGYIKGMLDGVANTEEKRRRYLEVAYKKACDMDVLLSKLFYFSKLETGNMPFFRQKIRIDAFLQQYVSDKRRELEMQQGTLILEAEDMTGVCCSMDKEQFTRVFDNLIENSIKYGEKAETLLICFRLGRCDGQIIIEVSDNGKGVPEDKLPHIFEQFYRGDEARGSRCDGNGLGLYVCQYIVAAHDGKIQAYNENGLHIRITLPEMAAEGKTTENEEQQEERYGADFDC